MEQLKSEIAGFTKLAIIGIGSELRNDDAVGIEIVSRLQDRLQDQRIECLIGGTTPENLTGALRRSQPSHIILIDAAATGQPPGTVSLVDPAAIRGGSFSTHALSLKDLVNYLRQELGAKVLVLGIEPKDINFGDRLSPEAEQAVQRVTELLAAPL